MYKYKILAAIILTVSCSPLYADIASAKRFGELMEILGASVTVDPDYSGTEAEFVYRLDGSTISCTRGITHGVFAHNCSRMSASLREKINLARVQRALKERGYKIGKIDGVFGKNTSAAISAYQKDNGIEVTGKTSTRLLLRLNKN